MLKRIFPGLLWLEGYKGNLLKSDLLSGLTITFMLIPQGMGYAMVAGLPPEFGLYACVIPPLIYALLGTSNKISIGPVALDSILILGGLSLLATPGTDKYIELAVVLTLMVGVFQALLGFVRMGFISNFLSYPVIIGYTSAAAIVIMTSQLDNLLGADIDNTHVILGVVELLAEVGSWDLLTALLGLAGIVFLLLGARLNKSLPYPLILLVVGMFVSGVFEFQSQGVKVVSFIPQGFPLPYPPSVSLEDLASLVPLALTVALMGYVGSMSICKSLEKPTDKVRTRPNQELIALGFANLVGALFRAFPVSASFSRSAAFRQAGAKTQVSALVSSLSILVILLFLTPIFASFPLPKTFLAVIVIVSVMGLFKYKDMKMLAQYSLKEFYICMATFLITLVLGVQSGLMAGVSLSIIMLIYKTTNPHIAELGALDNGKLYRNITRFEDAKLRDDVLIFRFDAPIYFANKDYLFEKLNTLVEKRDIRRLEFVILEAESINSIDITGLMMLQQVSENLEKQGVQFAIANAIGPVRDVIKNSFFNDFLCEECMFTTVHDAIDYIDKGVLSHRKEALQTNSR